MIQHYAAIFGIVLPSTLAGWFWFLARWEARRLRAPALNQTPSGPGDIGLTQITGRMGWAIRLGQFINRDGFRDYEHAFVYLGDGKTVEAQPGGAKVRPLSHHDQSRILWIHCPDEYRERVCAEALKLVDTPYSFLDYLAIFLYRLHLPSKRIRNYVDSTDHMICSQLAVEAAHRGGWMLPTPHPLEQDITPGDLSKIALQQEK